jgi:hypothetical protein
MPLASEADVENALGRSLTSTEDVSTLLEEASDLVVGYLGYTPDPVPTPVARVAATMVAAVLTKPALTVADYNQGGANSIGYNTVRESASVRVGVESATTTGPWLTASLKMRLRPYRTAATRSVFSISLVDPDVEAGS